MIVSCKGCKKPVQLPDRKLKKGEVPPIILVFCATCKQYEEDRLRFDTKTLYQMGRAIGPVVSKRAT